jgi:ribosomal protein S12 methylthiotransferase
MPLQHAAEPVLRAMNRPGNGQVHRAMLAKLRRAAPGSWVRSTFLVGFPGETEADFQELLAFVREGQIDWLGGFRFSREEGTPAAALPRQVSGRTAARRFDQLMEAQYEVMAERLRARVGTEVEVLIEAVEDRGRARGRIAGQAPDVDGETSLDVRGLPGCRPGDFVRATITGVDGFDLLARAAARLHRPPHPAAGLLQIDVN